VQIHHSRDLVNWRPVRRPLDRASQLDLRGEPDSCGVWAPCLSYADGKFWLVYTDVKRFDGDFKDAHNHIKRSRRGAGTRSTSTRAASTHRCFTTTTVASGSSTWSGTIATEPAPT
jgi:xylan 1,4-beta-xylosidase